MEATIGNKKKQKNKDHRIFSWPLFKESLKSNALSWSIVSLGNAILVIIVVLIMSSLNINSTKESMANMLNQANMEENIKLGAIEMDLSYHGSALAYQTLNEGERTAKDLAEALVEAPSNSLFTSVVSIAEKSYDYNYGKAEGDESQRHRKAVEDTLASIETIVPDEYSSYVEPALTAYLDAYASDKDSSTTKRLINTLPQIGATLAKGVLPEADSSEVLKVFNTLFNNCYEGTSLTGDVDDASQKAAFGLIDAAIPEELSSFASPLISALETAYEQEPERYEDPSDSYRQEILVNSLKTTLVDMMNNMAYFSFLPSFDVNCLTDEEGYPIAKVPNGEYDENGEPLYEVVRLTTYEPDKFIPVNEGMGSAANLLQKMHKEILTGEPYTEEEIASAKEQASASLDMVVDKLDDFLAYFVSDEPNPFISETGEIESSAIDSFVISQLKDMAVNELIDMYNETNGTNIDSLEEIIDIGNGMDGQAALNLVTNYAASGIASFKTLYQEKVNEGKETMAAINIALVYATKTVTNSLPTGVDGSLEDIANMNMYETMIGCIGFGIACLLIPMVYTIILENSLVAQKVESGSLAFTLSTPLRRSAFACTEAIYSIASTVGSSLLLFLFAIIGREIGIAAGGTDLIESLSVYHLFQFTLGNFMVVLAISGICFLASSWFNKTAFAIGTGGGLTIFFYVAAIIGLFGNSMMPSIIRIDSLNAFNYMTIMSFNDGVAVINNDPVFYYKLFGLLGIAIATYSLAIYRFDTKDLPL